MYSNSNINITMNIREYPSLDPSGNPVGSQRHPSGIPVASLWHPTHVNIHRRISTGIQIHINTNILMNIIYILTLYMFGVMAIRHHVGAYL